MTAAAKQKANRKAWVYEIRICGVRFELFLFFFFSFLFCWPSWGLSVLTGGMGFGPVGRPMYEKGGVNMRACTCTTSVRKKGTQ